MEIIKLNSKQEPELNKALEKLLDFSSNFDKLENNYFQNKAIQILVKENNKDVEIELIDFILGALQYPELNPKILQIVENIAKSGFHDGEDDYVFREFVKGFACIKKEFIKFYITYLESVVDMEHEMGEEDDINEIIEKYSWCKETMDLIIARYIKYSGQNGNDQFLNFVNNDFGKWLKIDDNINLFFDTFVKQMSCSLYSYKNYAETYSKALFDALYGAKSTKAKNMHQKAMMEYDELCKEINNLNSLWNNIDNKTDAVKVEKIYDRFLDINDPKLNRKISEIYHDWANEVAEEITGNNVTKWNEDIEAKFEFAIDLCKKSIKYASEKDKHPSKADKIEQILIIYANWGETLMESGNSEKNKNIKIELYEKGISHLNEGFKYNPTYKFLLNNYCYILIGLLSVKKVEEQIKKYINEISFYIKALDQIETNKADYCILYMNSAVLFASLQDKENTYKYLEMGSKVNKERKIYKKKDLLTEKNLDFIKSEPKFQDLIEKYFPDKKKAKPIEKKSETKTVNKEAKIDLSGKKVCLTGKAPLSRAEVAKILTEKGAIVQDSVNKTTEILICGEEDTESSKAKKAREQGVQILTYNQVIDF